VDASRFPENETQVSLVTTEWSLTVVFAGSESLAPGLHSEPRAMGSHEDRVSEIKPVCTRAKGVGLYV